VRHIRRDEHTRLGGNLVLGKLIAVDDLLADERLQQTMLSFGIELLGVHGFLARIASSSP